MEIPEINVHTAKLNVTFRLNNEYVMDSGCAEGFAEK